MYAKYSRIQKKDSYHVKTVTPVDKTVEGNIQNLWLNSWKNTVQGGGGNFGVINS